MVGGLMNYLLPSLIFLFFPLSFEVTCFCVFLILFSSILVCCILLKKEKRKTKRKKKRVNSDNVDNDTLHVNGFI